MEASRGPKNRVVAMTPNGPTHGRKEREGGPGNIQRMITTTQGIIPNPVMQVETERRVVHEDGTGMQSQTSRAKGHAVPEHVSDGLLSDTTKRTHVVKSLGFAPSGSCA